jgi:hypothetical protein
LTGAKAQSALPAAVAQPELPPAVTSAAEPGPAAALLDVLQPDLEARMAQRADGAEPWAAPSAWARPALGQPEAKPRLPDALEP